MIKEQSSTCVSPITWATAFVLVSSSTRFRKEVSRLSMNKYKNRIDINIVRHDSNIVKISSIKAILHLIFLHSWLACTVELALPQKAKNAMEKT